MEPVLFEIKNSIARITLNRPEKYNAFNREMALQLLEYLDACENAQEVRCVTLTGAGKAFSSGQDLAEVVDPHGPGMDKILKEQFNPIVKKIRELDKPVLMIVNGVAAGAGANIALCGDVVVAGTSAKFIQAFSKIGLIPDSGGTYTLPRLIGYQRASALMMLGESVPAADAEKMGMIYKSFPDENLGAESQRLAEQLAQLPTKGLAYTKKALQVSMSNCFREQLIAEDKYQQMAAATDDFKEGVRAFIEKRKPLFKGK